MEPLPSNKVLALSDFDHPDLLRVLRGIFPHQTERFGAAWPRGLEYRKDWEVAMAVLALERGGALRPDARILGVGAGNEPTIFHLTGIVGEVHATDLYLAEPPPRPKSLSRRLGNLSRALAEVVRPSRHGARAWEESANLHMFLDPGRYWPRPWNARRLVVQHMNGLELRYEDDSFDGLFSSGSIEHFGGHAEVSRAAREMARVLAPGGILSISTEYRLAGPGPGLPGILMFDRAELTSLIVDASGLEPIDAFQTVAAGEVGPPRAFDAAAANVRRHVAEHGEILFHKLTWPEYPAVALRSGQREWTSCHVALRKPPR